MTAQIRTIILKAVSTCNLACSYCSAHCAEKAPAQVNPETVCLVFKELLEAGKIASSCKFLWHGGEPTLYDAQCAGTMMERLQILAKEYAIDLHFTMQTNGFQISPAWLDLIKDHYIGIGVSLDGPQDIHDAYRQTSKQKGSYVQIKKNVTMLGDMGIPVSLLSVIDGRHQQQVDRFFDWSVQMNLPIKLNPCFYPDMDAVDFQSYFDFLKEYLIRLLAGEVDISVEPLAGMIRAVLFDSPASECIFSGNCGKHILCIDYNDHLSACGRLSDQKESSFPVLPGKISDTVTRIRMQAQKELSIRQGQLLCSQCPYFKACHAGCSAYLCSTNAPAYCQAFKNFMEFMTSEALVLLKQRLINEKNAVISELNHLQMDMDGRAHE